MNKQEMIEVRDIFINKMKSKGYELYETPKFGSFKFPKAYLFFDKDQKVATLACDEDLDHDLDFAVQLHFGHMDTALLFDKRVALVIIDQFIN